MASAINHVREPAHLQRLISEAVWEVKKSASEGNPHAVQRAERRLGRLLDRLAGCVLAGNG